MINELHERVTHSWSQ
jgi:hypothetical protein